MLLGHWNKSHVQTPKLAQVGRGPPKLDIPRGGHGPLTHFRCGHRRQWAGKDVPEGGASAVLSLQQLRLSLLPLFSGGAIVRAQSSGSVSRSPVSLVWISIFTVILRYVVSFATWSFRRFSAGTLIVFTSSFERLILEVSGGRLRLFVRPLGSPYSLSKPLVWVPTCQGPPGSAGCRPVEAVIVFSADVNVQSLWLPERPGLGLLWWTPPSWPDLHTPPWGPKHSVPPPARPCSVWVADRSQESPSPGKRKLPLQDRDPFLGQPCSIMGLCWGIKAQALCSSSKVPCKISWGLLHIFSTSSFAQFCLFGFPTGVDPKNPPQSTTHTRIPASRSPTSRERDQQMCLLVSRKPAGCGRRGILCSRGLQDGTQQAGPSTQVCGQGAVFSQVQAEASMGMGSLCSPRGG